MRNCQYRTAAFAGIAAFLRKRHRPDETFGVGVPSDNAGCENIVRAFSRVVMRCGNAGVINAAAQDISHASTGCRARPA